MNTTNNNLRKKKISLLYIFVILAIALNSVNFIPLLIEILKKKYTNNIPYMMLGFSLASSLILFYICIKNKYYIQLLLILINICVVSTIIFLKIDYDRKRKENYANYTKLNQIEYDNWHNKVMCRGKDSLSPLGKNINWNNINLVGNNNCSLK